MIAALSLLPLGYAKGEELPPPPFRAAKGRAGEGLALGALQATATVPASRLLRKKEHSACQQQHLQPRLGANLPTPFPKQC